MWSYLWRSAGLYLKPVSAFLVLATVLVTALKKYTASAGEQAHVTSNVLAAIIGLSLLFALVFNLIPELIKRYEQNFRPTVAGDSCDSGYFTTAPREYIPDDPHGFFAKGYDHFVEWAAKPPAPLLHLTGLSGSGKSSLLAACIKPRLDKGVGDEKTKVLILRSYTDPLAALKGALLPLWKEKPDDYDALSPLDALRRAARQLENNERLLVAFDQFEEFFLVRAAVPAGGTAAVGSAARAAPHTADADLAPLRYFFDTFLTNPPKGVALLLSYRWDYQGLLTPLGLPARDERPGHQNHCIVEPLDFATADAFIRGCPGLNVPPERMVRVLREAAREEGRTDRMRPIVANLLGLILQRMAGHPTLWERTDDLLRGYVADAIGREIIVERTHILRALLTDFKTAKPRAVASLAKATKLDPSVLAGHLEFLGHAGLLRRVNAAEKGTWQIAHDFLATLIERVLDGVRRTLWRIVRSWLAPAAVVLALAVEVLWPWVEKKQAVEALGNAGSRWESETESLLAESDKSKKIETLPWPIRRLHPRVINLKDCGTLQDLEGLTGLTGLENLDLSSCKALRHVDGLKALNALQTLSLNSCAGLQNVDGLKELTGLRVLALSNCAALQNVDGLKGLIGLRVLTLSNCAALENTDGLKGLTGLKTLVVSDCAALENIDGLKVMTDQQRLNLVDCYRIPASALRELRAALPKTNITFPDGTKSPSQ